MKKLIAVACFLTLYNFLSAQPGKTGVKPVPKVIKPKPLLKTLDDSASYAIGLSIAGFCKQQNVTTPNTELVSKCFSDVLEDKPTWMSEAHSNDIVNKLLMRGRVPDSTLGPATSIDSVSYAIGLNHALFFKQQGLTNLDTTYIVRAVNDVLGNKPLQFNDHVANNVMNKLIVRIQENKAKPNIVAGREFLAKNKKNPRVKTTASGLQYEIVRQGKGIRPAKADTFVCNYKGTLIDGTEFDNSYKRNQPLVYPVAGVIRGWTEGLMLMPVGSKYNFWIPYELAYGPFDNQAIPGGSVLVFELELLNVKKSKAARPPAKRN
ncbi:MAG: FKBP-type peptidyl-prolyl cis-trans isomerase N-terminal domain-containing protein [Chitinophagales bacterium]